MQFLLRLRLTLRIVLVLFLCTSPVLAQSQSGQPAPPAPPPSSGNGTNNEKASQSATGEKQEAEAQEVSTKDKLATFKVRVNVVLVRVVVRDAHGKLVPNLKKVDFRLLDNNKAQNISSFSIETPQSRSIHIAAPVATEAGSAEDGENNKIINLPQRFVSMVMDDIHMSVQDAMFVRNSAGKFLNSLAAGDRVGIYSTSGQVEQEFTLDRKALNEALLKVLPRPLGGSTTAECPDVNYYQADLIVNRDDSQAIDIATLDALACAFQNDPTMQGAAKALASSTAIRVLNQGNAEIDHAFRNLEGIERRLASMPGQRVLVLVSPGFAETNNYLDSSELVDRATRSNIVINTIDARGLYTPDLMGDIANHPQGSVKTVGYRGSYRLAAQFGQSEVLEHLADGTGGTFFHNRNDVDEAMKEAGITPEFSYLLGFSPQNLKLDGNFHRLKVKLNSKEKFTVQARYGYVAPKKIADPEESAKQEIEEALFSQDEIRDLPVELQTQFFKKETAEAKLAVLTRFDLKGIRFRNDQGRHNDKLTIVTGVFDENGNLVTSGEKIIEMKLRETTYQRLSRSGFLVKSSFDVKPGNYLVRLVVRDSEGEQLAARNGAVAIPY
jgi:VWFA-related protein